MEGSETANYRDELKAAAEYLRHCHEHQQDNVPEAIDRLLDMIGRVVPEFVGHDAWWCDDCERTVPGDHPLSASDSGCKTIRRVLVTDYPAGT